MTGNAAIDDNTGAITLPEMEPEMTDNKPASEWKDTDFPFQLADLAGWVVRNKDGSVVRWVLSENGMVSQGGIPSTALTQYSKQVTAPTSSASYGKYCQHDPAKVPVFEHTTAKGSKVQLFIADAYGAKNHKNEFDVIIDGGSVIFPYTSNSNIDGDKGLADLAKDYEYEAGGTYKLLHIGWEDRKAPPLYVNFWPALAVELEEQAEAQDTPLRVLTVCQGGHGRSGTALVSLMMVFSDYAPLDAITHLRAVHCPRAIESKIQHDYLNSLAKFLNREENAHDADAVTDFRGRFLTTVKSKFAATAQERLADAKLDKDTVAREK